jgi:hydrogenase maturation protease
MKTLILGLGNPILGDDGVGWRVAEEVAKRISSAPSRSIPDGLASEEVEVDFVSLGGLSLMERLADSQRVILIDAIFTGAKPVGSLSQFPLTDLPDLSSNHSASAHDTSLRNALNMGRSMDILLPDDENVYIVAIETEHTYDFSEKLSPPVEAAVPLAVEAVLQYLKEHS